MDCFHLFSAITSAPDSLRTEDLGRHVWGMFVLQKCEHSPGPSTGWMSGRTPKTILSLGHLQLVAEDMGDVRQLRKPQKQAVQLVTEALGVRMTV